MIEFDLLVMAEAAGLRGTPVFEKAEKKAWDNLKENMKFLKLFASKKNKISKKGMVVHIK